MGTATTWARERAANGMSMSWLQAWVCRQCLGSMMNTLAPYNYFYQKIVFKAQPSFFFCALEENRILIFGCDHIYLHSLFSIWYGGKRMRIRIVDWLASNFKRDEGIDLLKDRQGLQRLTKTAGKAKMELSSLTQTNINLPFITAITDGSKHIETTLTRAEFEEFCSNLLDRLKTPVENSLRDAKLSFTDVDVDIFHFLANMEETIGKLPFQHLLFSYSYILHSLSFLILCKQRTCFDEANVDFGYAPI
ncbi:Stromal 70 kDa heat shock-related protein [Spatholobus suberectus]|nr:Stromal 70 kDa heat shock-related protein [Spatholobus suberectus]